MKIVKNIESEKLINALIFLTGLISVLAGVIFENAMKEQVSTVLISIGASIIASSVVAYITSVYLLKRKKQKEITEIWGLRSITGNRSEMNVEIDRRLEKMSKSLDIIAYGLKSFRESKGNLLMSKIERGVKIRILTVNPDSEVLAYRDSAENKINGSTANDIRQLVKWLGEFESSSVEIRFCEFLPTELYFRVDDRIFVGPYEIGKESQRTITLEFAGDTKGFGYYSDYFESLWSTAGREKM